MKRALTLFALLVCATIAGAQTVNSYEINVALHPDKGELSAITDLNITAANEGIDQAKFYLNTGLKLESVKCPVCAAYSFDAAKAGEYMFAVDAAPVVVKFARRLNRGESIRLRFTYNGHIVVGWGVNLLSAQWTELGLYSAWYPMVPDSRFTYEIKASLDPGYVATGPGTVERLRTTAKAEANCALRPTKWRLTSSQPGNDLILIAAPNLKTRTITHDHLQIRVDSILPADKVEPVTNDINRAVEQYTNWFGPAVGERLTIVFNPRTRGGAYVRPGFISFPYDGSIDRKVLTRYLGHEVSHLWWTGAPVDSWEDWLNESFAEYSGLMLVRQWDGAETFETQLATRREQSAGKPAIWGIGRDNKDAHTVLYSKGAIVLHELENMLGEKEFAALAASLAHQQPRSTDALLALLESRTSRETRNKFEGLLKN